MSLLLQELPDAGGPVGHLSRGDRSRLALLVLLTHRTNVLLLDEPANHLDLPSRERFAEALEGYGGTLVIASHDRFLLDRLCNVTWAIEGNAVVAFEGNYTTFRRSAG